MSFCQNKTPLSPLWHCHRKKKCEVKDLAGLSDPIKKQVEVVSEDGEGVKSTVGSFRNRGVRIGIWISFTRHFFKPMPMRTLDEIKADLRAIQAEGEGLLEEIVGTE